jgi:hypothetical protein
VFAVGHFIAKIKVWQASNTTQIMENIEVTVGLTPTLFKIGQIAILSGSSAFFAEL